MLEVIKGITDAIGILKALDWIRARLARRRASGGPIGHDMAEGSSFRAKNYVNKGFETGLRQGRDTSVEVEDAEIRR